MAENPIRIRRLFANSEYPSNGVFKLYFYSKGIKTSVVIDDRLPIENSYTLLNTKASVNGAYWMPILEKAYAKFSFNYANINGFMPITAIRDLTGYPA